MSEIKVACPWCEKLLSDTGWYVNDVFSERDFSYCLPELGEKLTCSGCNNGLVVSGMTLPTISVSKGASKAQYELEALKGKAEWKDKVTELRKKYLNIPACPTLSCKLFGHKWEALARSGYSDNFTVPFSSKSFSVCSKCLTAVDSLKDPEYGFWIR